MKKLDILSFMQEGLEKISVNLLEIDNRLEEIESLIANKCLQGFRNDNSHIDAVEDHNPHEKLNKVQAAKI